MSVVLNKYDTRVIWLLEEARFDPICTLSIVYVVNNYPLSSRYFWVYKYIDIHICIPSLVHCKFHPLYALLSLPFTSYKLFMDPRHNTTTIRSYSRRMYNTLGQNSRVCDIDSTRRHMYIYMNIPMMHFTSILCSLYISLYGH